MCGQWALQVQSSKIYKIQLTWEDNFFPKKEAGLVSNTLYSAYSEFSQMNQSDPVCTGINGKDNTCSAGWGAPNWAVCAGGHRASPQHTVKRNSEYFITLQVLLEAWSVLARGGIFVSVWPQPLLWAMPQWTPQTLHRTIKHHRKSTPSCTTSTLCYTSAIIWRFQTLFCPPYITV